MFPVDESSTHKNPIIGCNSVAVRFLDLTRAHLYALSMTKCISQLSTTNISSARTGQSTSEYIHGLHNAITGDPVTHPLFSPCYGLDSDIYIYSMKTSCANALV